MNYLFKSFPHCEINYEPKGVVQDGKDCDLEIKYQGKRYLVEMKSFHPMGTTSECPLAYTRSICFNLESTILLTAYRCRFVLSPKVI
jgi:hypothetical protein